MTGPQLREAQALREQGFTMREISRSLGIPYTTVLYWLSPGRREAEIIRKRKHGKDKPVH
jgi:hypothetical protein